jgi:hypothetical protein
VVPETDNSPPAPGCAPGTFAAQQCFYCRPGGAGPAQPVETGETARIRDERLIEDGFVPNNARASVAIAERVFHAAIVGEDERDGITGPH